ncbi:uncharacterized protein BYT42DRAFT_491665 [Radiomyces spectabilis]|uniref:uncharacterized protein n=1 Tax=Radiomyces spectabilis TaxID=64574 RepID=UPI00221F3FB4|nr:uncharacterized protein BYT42DRAFT_491665 [Radiomyces spectabilis]KAI8388383.1 hypothetical protein BYT42DRAFT_491665 [Radiomyces spectabilis]
MSRSLSAFWQQFSANYKRTRFPWKKHALIGSDLDGNEYWEMPNPLGGRPKRWVQMRQEDDYTIFRQDQLPVQWQAWLRHTRYEAPTTQDLIKEIQRQAIVQQRAKQLDMEWEQRKLQLAAEAEAENQPATKLEAKATSQHQQPTGQGETFVPGAWNPSSAKRR